MKKLIFYFIFSIFFIASSYAQSTLQFSQVLLVTSATTTVPVGKVWKIENILPTARLADADIQWNIDGTTVGTTNLDKIIIINGQSIIVQSTTATTKVQKQISGTTTEIRSSNSGYGFAWGILDGPIWLPASTTLAASTGVYAISVIEFSVVP